MRKILFFMLLLVQLTAATAFAYTNKEDGFKTQSLSSANYVEAVGKHFYGFIDDNGAAAGYTECLSSEQASKFLGVPFRTAAFDKTYSDILLLQRNGISNERINQLIAEPVVSPLFAFAENEEPDLPKVKLLAKLLIWLLYLTVTVMMKIRHLNFGTAKHF